MSRDFQQTFWWFFSAVMLNKVSVDMLYIYIATTICNTRIILESRSLFWAFPWILEARYWVLEQIVFLWVLFCCFNLYKEVCLLQLNYICWDDSFFAILNSASLSKNIRRKSFMLVEWRGTFFHYLDFVYPRLTWKILFYEILLKLENFLKGPSKEQFGTFQFMSAKFRKRGQIFLSTLHGHASSFLFIQNWRDICAPDVHVDAAKTMIRVFLKLSLPIRDYLETRSSCKRS